ncbi:LacI family DNA-binding transcriptional regulator [Arthrobacter bambusae]|uniref:LacI family DNA-binding transcriptional regulator n=1 Tax=Arthrobacter bambusae TaxID=1338426 RepID=UPI002785B3B4|nr:LacI family DNA-binding transcriptional regulator [Arthrobacter bambusae]MDQ0029158.1 LacI family transcriptional regulator [Arthrobacter bambusae]MDQ0098067.1 LacI family transcriptional regulator [Arthrobacter bambusae]
MRPTIKSVAAVAGVSTATVSYVLSGRSGKAGGGSGSGVAPATVLRVQEAAKSLGYRPNQAARAIRTGRTNLLMLSLTMISDPWALDISRAVGTAAGQHGITPMILADTDWRIALKRQNADVTFIDAAEEPGDAELLAQAAKLQRLVVFSDTMEPQGFDVVRSMPGSSCDQAVAHLTSRHVRVGCLAAAPRPGNPISIRLRAYIQGLAAAGLDYRDEYVERFDLDTQSAFDAAQRLLLRKDRPTAIYATTDFAAIAAIHAAQRLQLRVPEDVEVVGIGNTTEGEFMAPSLTTVGPEGFFDGVAEFLLDRAEDPDAPSKVLEFPWSLIVRDSAPAV